MNDHLQACPHCDKFVQHGIAVGCSAYRDTSWVNRRGGCPHFPYRELPARSGLSYIDGKIVGRGRVGQQKQAHQDRSYSGKNSRRGKYARSND
jgi:hypothetical protein